MAAFASIKVFGSFNGGRIVEMRNVTCGDLSTDPPEKDPAADDGIDEPGVKERYTIYFENRGDKARDIAWRGRHHAMAYISGVIEVDDI